MTLTYMSYMRKMNEVPMRLIIGLLTVWTIGSLAFCVLIWPHLASSMNEAYPAVDEVGKDDL